MMDDVFKFVATFKEFPPRSSPPSFNPANVMEDTLREIKAKQKLETRLSDAAAGTDARKEIAVEPKSHGPTP